NGLLGVPAQTGRLDPFIDLQLADVTVEAGGLVINDSAFSNTAGHTFSLLGGVLSVPGLTNFPGATIKGFGQLTGDFTNNGSASFFGPMQIVGTFLNKPTGIVAVRNAQTLVVGTATNNGSITTSNGTIIFDSGAARGAGASSLSAPGGIDGSGTFNIDA